MTISVLEEAASALTANDASRIRGAMMGLFDLIKNGEAEYIEPFLVIVDAFAAHDVAPMRAPRRLLWTGTGICSQAPITRRQWINLPRVCSLIGLLSPPLRRGRDQTSQAGEVD